MVEAMIQEAYSLTIETVGFHEIHISFTSYKFASGKCDVYNPFNLIVGHVIQSIIRLNICNILIFQKH